jgi:hypothetical protein
VVTDGTGLRAAADQDAAFEVGFHCAAGEVGPGDERDLVIDDDDLGVQRCSGRPLAGWPAKAGCGQRRERHTSRGVGGVICRVLGQERDLHAASTSAAWMAGSVRVA